MIILYHFVITLSSLVLIKLAFPGPWRNCSDYQIESTSLGTRNDSNSLITKSCPATPRGSFPDLLASAENERNEANDDDVDDDGKRRAST